MSLRPHKGEQIPICDGGRQEAVWIYQSIPYCRQIHSTALGGSIFDLRFTPNRANWQRFSFIHRQKVVRLTPAASANSVLYALFMVFPFDCKGTKKTRDMQVKMLLFSYPSAIVARRSQGRKIIEICKGNHEKNTLYCYLLFQIVSACLNASFGCRTFALEFKRIPVMFANFKRELGQLHTWKSTTSLQMFKAAFKREQNQIRIWAMPSESSQKRSLTLKI